MWYMNMSVIGHAKEYPSMHHFGIPKHPDSAIAIRFWSRIL